jgi:hypothetical protein
VATFATRHELLGEGNYCRFVWPFSKASGSIYESTLPNAVTINAAVELPTGEILPLTFNGSSSISMTYGVLISDPVWIPKSDGYFVHVLSCLTVANSSLHIPGSIRGLSATNRENLGLGEGCAASDMTSTGKAGCTLAPLGDSMFGPICIIEYCPPGGRKPQQSFGVIMDSHGDTNDQIFGRGTGGLWDRACAEQYAGNYDVTKASRAIAVPLWKGGESSQDVVDNNFIRSQILPFCTDLVFECSNHDDALSTASWKALLKLVIGLAAKAQAGRQLKKNCYIVGPYPKVSALDAASIGSSAYVGFTTVANQTNVNAAGRNTMATYLRDGTFRSESQGIMPNIVCLDLCANFEVNSSNALTTNGGLFLVPSQSADWSASITGASPLSKTAFRTNLAAVASGGPTDAQLQACIVRITSGKFKNQYANVQYGTRNGDGTVTLQVTPSLTAAAASPTDVPAAADTFDLMLGSSSAFKGAACDNGGIHQFKNGHARLAKALNDLGIFTKSGISPYSVPTPTTVFNPLDWGTPIRCYSMLDLADVYTTSAKATNVAAAADPIGAIVAARLSDGNRYGGDLLQATAGFRPTYDVTAFPAALFDGSDDILADTTGSTLTGPVTWFLVVRQVSTPASTNRFMMDTGSSSSTRHRLTATTANARQVSAGTTLAAGSWVNGTTYVVGIKFKTDANVGDTPSAGTGACKVYVNGSQVASSLAGVQTTVRLYLGGDRSSTAGNFSNFALSYLCSYNAAIADADMVTMSRQISNLFGGIY